MNTTNKKVKAPRKDTPLNLWVKGLDKSSKKIFYKNLLKSPMLWSEEKTKDQKRWIFNNYRKKGITDIPQAFKIQIYICALSIDFDLKIQTIFPELDIEYMRPVMVAIKCFAQNLYSIYVKDKEEQSHFLDA